MEHNPDPCVMHPFTCYKCRDRVVVLTKEQLAKLLEAAFSEGLTTGVDWEHSRTREDLN